MSSYKFKRKITRIELVTLKPYPHFYLGWTIGKETFRIMLPFIWIDIHAPFVRVD